MSDGAERAARSGLLRAYEAAVVVPTLAWLAHRIIAEPRSFSDPLVLFWVAAIALVDLMPVSVASGIQLSLSFPIVLAVAMLYSPSLAMLIVFVGSFDPRELMGQLPAMKALFIRAQIAVSVLVQGLLFHGLASLSAPWYRLAPAVLITIVAGYVVNVWFVAVYMRLSEGLSIREALQQQRVGALMEFVLSYIGLSLLGFVIAHLYLHDGRWAVAAFLVPLVFGRQMYFRSRALSDRLSEQNALLADQAHLLQMSLDREHEAVAELRELNRMKSEFVAVASHELRTPLTTIIGYAKTLRQPQFSNDDAIRDEFLQVMERQGDRLLRLVENLLLTANVENRQLNLSLAPVSLEDLFRECVEGLGTRRDRISIHLESLPEIVTDRHMLGRVVSNLLDNALKYSAEGSPCELGAGRKGDGVELWVTDHGVGISREEIARIFDRFYQSDSSPTRAFGGVGLGLSLVSDLVRAMAGAVDVQSQVRQGSTFRVTLPLVHPEARNGARRPQEPVAIS